MTALADGSVFCDRCGAYTGTGGLVRVAVVSALIDNGAAVANLHLCTFTGLAPGAAEGSPEGERCVTRVLTKKALNAYAATNGDAPSFYEWTPEPESLPQATLDGFVPPVPTSPRVPLPPAADTPPGEPA